MTTPRPVCDSVHRPLAGRADSFDARPVPCYAERRDRPGPIPTNSGQGIAAVEAHMSEEVIIRLTVPEAVVIDAFLRRYSETDQLIIADQAEQRALWNLQCLFEKVGDPSWPSVEDSRAALRDVVEE